MFHVNCVPADLRNLERRIRRRDLLHVARDPAEAFGDRLLQPAIGHELHADTDAEKRPSLGGDGDLLDGLPHALDGMQAGGAVCAGATPAARSGSPRARRPHPP